MNIALAIMHTYPNSKPIIDFEVRDDSNGEGQYIAVWNLIEPQPTEEELETAWAAYEEAEANKPPVLTEIEKLKKENLLLRAQNNSLSERADFIEDVISEMAIQMYQ